MMNALAHAASQLADAMEAAPVRVAVTELEFLGRLAAMLRCGDLTVHGFNGEIGRMGARLRASVGDRDRGTVRLTLRPVPPVPPVPPWVAQRLTADRKREVIQLPQNG